MSKKTRRNALAAGLTSATETETSADTKQIDAIMAHNEAQPAVLDALNAAVASVFDLPIAAQCRAAEIPLPAITGLSMDDDAASDAEADALLDAEAAITATEPTSAEPASDTPPVTYMLVIAGQHDTLASAAMHAQQYGKLARVTVCVARADTGETVQCFEHRGRGKRSAATDDGVHAPRGSAWDSKSGLAVQAMLRPEGATMDEMRMHTGWTFGQKYVAQLARSFRVVISTHDATARVKRTWHASPAAGFMPVGEYVAPSDDAGNVVHLADRMAAD